MDNNEKNITPVQLTIRAYLNLNEIEKAEIMRVIGFNLHDLHFYSPHDRDSFFFKHVKDKGLMPQLWEAVNGVEPFEEGKNPFIKIDPNMPVKEEKNLQYFKDEVAKETPNKWYPEKGNYNNWLEYQKGIPNNDTMQEMNAEAAERYATHMAHQAKSEVWEEACEAQKKVCKNQFMSPYAQRDAKRQKAMEMIWETSSLFGTFEDDDYSIVLAKDYEHAIIRIRKRKHLPKERWWVETENKWGKYCVQPLS